MLKIEDVIRATQARQADRAVPPDRIRSALPTRIARAGRRRRAGRLGTVLVAAAAATAITVPTLLLHRDEPAAPAAGRAVSAPASAATAAQLPPIRLGYAPTWAPPGFAEHIRSFFVTDPPDELGPSLQRVWTKQTGPGDPWGGAELMLSVRTEVTDPAAAVGAGGPAVDINGHPGHYVPAEGKKSYVSWQAGEHTMLMLSASHYAIAQKDLLRMARSVRPEPGTNAVPVRLRHLPAGWSTTGITVSGQSAATWRAEVAAAQPAPELPPDKSKMEGKAGPGSLSVTVGSTAEAPAGGTELTVGGRPARHPVRADQPGRDLIYLVVDLGAGRVMTLVGQGDGLTLADLTKVAEQAEITPAGLDWLGR